MDIKPEWKINSYKNEDQFQAAAIMFISQLFPRLRFKVFHPKNEGYIRRLTEETDEEYRKVKMIEGGKNKAKGVLSGVMDILIVHNGILYKIELKQPEGSLSPAQEELITIWNKDCTEIPVRVCYTLEQVLLYCEKIIKDNYKINFNAITTNDMRKFMTWWDLNVECPSVMYNDNEYLDIYSRYKLEAA